MRRRRTSAPQSWMTLLALYSATSLVEGLGVSQIFAFMPLYLLHMGVATASIPHVVGVLSSLVFLLGLPLVPLWGVWADKYSRKAVIIRSAVVEGVVFTLVALSRTPAELGGALLLVGFQLGNTGVMLAAIRDSTPADRLGTAIAVFGASGAAGFAIGPLLGGLLIEAFHTPIATVYWLASGLSFAVALVLAVGSREVRPDVVPQGGVMHLAYGAVRGVFADRATRLLFAVFGLAFLARQLATPFIPILVQDVAGNRAVAGSVAIVTGVAALAGAAMSPIGGAIGDRVGFGRVLVVVLLGAGVALALMPLAPTVAALALVAVAFTGLSAVATAMIYGLLAIEISAERRSATLNLVLLPLYLTGIVGPAIGAAVATVGLSWAFVAGGLVLFAAVPVALIPRSPSRAPLLPPGPA